MVIKLKNKLTITEIITKWVFFKLNLVLAIIVLGCQLDYMDMKNKKYLS